MHIKSLVIDGFKSYGKRVELNDFDPEFNAITGLNGTGKSNILDSICFALGISAMNTIRASTMQDVIYKSGQAGVHTATVTITFDNRDKSRSAPNYEEKDEIIISREVGMGSKNTYRINGLAVPAKKMMDFFNSLQMNVNNPHFIIMQGRITKVLNMKPIEILSMIEEAAGTNMYESKKKSLELTVGRKDSKLNELKTVADEEILPTMESIDKEKQMMEEYNILNAQLRKQKEKLDSWNYVQLTKQIEKETIETKIIEDRKKKKLDLMSGLEEQIIAMKEEIKKKEQEMEEDGGIKLEELEKKVKKVEQEKDTIQVEINKCKINIKEEVKKIKGMEKQINNSKKDFDAKKKEIDDFNKIYATLNEDNKKYTEELDEIDNKIRSLNSGDIFTDNENGSVQENIDKFNLELQNQQIENQQCSIKIDGLKKKLNEHLTGINEAQKAYDKQMSLLTAKEKEYEKVKNEYLKSNDELSHYDNLRSSRDGLLRQIQDLNSKTESFECNNSNLFFHYNDPYPNFDRRKVHGLVCRLFKPVDFRFELALTNLAGGKLYFIVIEDDTVGKDILETNKFPNRMNFIPLSKIKCDSMPQHVIQRAQQIGGANQVFPAMSLIKYDKKHLKALQWVFGQAFICTTKEIAEKVCFDSKVNRHCFTLEGDHFNPSGSLTGGANTQRLILQAIANQDEITSQLQTKKSEFTQIDNRISEMSKLTDKVAQLRDRQFIVQEELKKIQSDVHLGQPHQQVTEVNNIKQQLAELENQLAKGIANEKQLKSKIKDLEIQMKNAKNILKKQLSEAEQRRKNILAKINSKKTEYDKKKDNYDKLELEIKDLTSQIQEEETQLADINEEKNRLEQELITIMSQFDEVDIRYKDEFKKYDSQKEKVKKGNRELETVTKTCKEMSFEIESIKVDLAKAEASHIKKLQELEIVEQNIAVLNEKMSDEQKEMASKLDYTNFKPDECKETVNKLTARQSELQGMVDPSKLNSFHKHILEYKKLERKLETIVKDKHKIHEIIVELEVKKQLHLQRAADRVNLEFGKIFSSVLPGAQACLRQVNPDDITAGLEIRVAFNGLWKDSLDELSGGQRSLVALSLVLAMLLFNPVPLYILDEVDAALDLSHTQNIGKMLKQHFRQSQFIVVSLKDGMFSNANVLFRTKFVDGSSAVTRTTCQQK